MAILLALYSFSLPSWLPNGKDRLVQQVGPVVLEDLGEDMIVHVSKLTPCYPTATQLEEQQQQQHHLKEIFEEETVDENFLGFPDTSSNTLLTSGYPEESNSKTGGEDQNKNLLTFVTNDEEEDTSQHEELI